MKCKNCKCKNTRRANYCINCGNKFSEEEKEKAEKKSLLTWLKRWSNLKNIKGFGFIIDNDMVKFAFILALCGVTILSIVDKTNKIELRDGTDYSLEYYEKENVYYIMQGKETYFDNDKMLKLNMYIPNKVDTYYINLYGADNELIKEEKYKKDDTVYIDANTIYNNYYLISDNKDFKNAIKLYAYLYEEE